MVTTTTTGGIVKFSTLPISLLFCGVIVFLFTVRIKYNITTTLPALSSSSQQQQSTLITSSSERKATANNDIIDVTTNSLRSTNVVTVNQQQESSNILPDKPSDTGRRIYVDLGANCGNSYWRVKLGMSEGTEETLKKPNATVWESYLWECNPQLIEWYLNDLATKEPNVVIIPKAATTYNGQATFHLTAGQESATKDQVPNSKCDPKSPYQPGGASTLFSTAKRAGSSITVDTVDFLQWHKDLNLQPGDSVHMKMDIEGAELDIIEQFVSNDTTNQICYWYVFWIEYHKEIFQPNTKEYDQHDKFEQDFPKQFKEKCGRDLWPNVYVR